MNDDTALAVIRSDIRDLRLYLDGKFDGIDLRLREVEQQAAAAKALAKVALTAAPFAVAAFSFALIKLFGG